MEAVVATAISVIAIVGLAHTFGMGRHFIDRFAIGRVALGEIRGQMDFLTTQPANSDSLALNRFFARPFNYQGNEIGTLEWRIAPYDDPGVPGTMDLKQVVIVAKWGSGVERDSIRITRLFPF